MWEGSRALWLLEPETCTKATVRENQTPSASHARRVCPRELPTHSDHSPPNSPQFGRDFETSVAQSNTWSLANCSENCKHEDQKLRPEYTTAFRGCLNVGCYVHQTSFQRLWSEGPESSKFITYSRVRAVFERTRPPREQNVPRTSPRPSCLSYAHRTALV